MTVLRKLLQLFVYGRLGGRNLPHKISRYSFIGMVDQKGADQ